MTIQTASLALNEAADWSVGQRRFFYLAVSL